jgi:hypothetical protein
VTRRFPDGLTVLKGAGQFRDEHRVVRKEAAFVLVVLYPDATREKSSRKYAPRRVRVLGVRALTSPHHHITESPHFRP